jgi:outer membrane protein
MKVSVVSLALGLALGAPALVAAQAPPATQAPATQAPATQAPAAEQPAAQQQPPLTTPSGQPPQPFPQTVRVGVIDMLRVFGDTAWGKGAQTRIDSLGQKKTAELSERNKKLQSDNQKLETGMLNDAARKETQASIARQEKELQRAQQDAQEEFNQLRQEVQESFNAKLGPILQTLVSEKKITMLFRTTDSGLVFFDQSLDLTAEVIKRFDAVNPPTASATPSTPAPGAPAATPTPPASTPPPATPAPKPSTPAPKPPPKD